MWRPCQHVSRLRDGGEARCATMDMAQTDKEDVIGPNSCEQVGMSFVLDGRRSCAVVGPVAWSQKKFYFRYHGGLNEERGEAMAFGERYVVGGRPAFQLDNFSDKHDLEILQESPVFYDGEST